MKYFHLVANGKHRKKKIFALDQDEGKIEGQAALKSSITRFYKELFGAPENKSFSFDKSWVLDLPQVSAEENNFLTSLFRSEEEARAAIFAMEHNKAPVETVS